MSSIRSARAPIPHRSTWAPAKWPTPESPDALHEFLRRELDLTLPRSAIVQRHAAPFDYLVHAFFEGTLEAPEESATPDCVVWANRGGGKTFLGAVATLLDLVFKPGIQVRILGGSLEQSQRMFEHLRTLFARPAFGELLDQRPTQRRIRLDTGSCVEVLAASQTSVRGTRVQKIRCDEVDLFDPEVWEAAQLATRSMPCRGPWGETVRGSLEALSTMHRTHGLMWKLASKRRASEEEDHPGPQRRLFRWGLLDVLEVCGAENACASCVLHEECRGRAKAEAREPHAGTPSGGHISVADAARMKRRVDRRTWDSEMLSLRPRRPDAVYADFDPGVHVVSGEGRGGTPGEEGTRGFFAAGMDFGIRAEAVVLLAHVDAAGVVTIEREHAQRGRTLDEHIHAIGEWIRAGHCAPTGLRWLGADPSGGALNEQTGVSSISLLRKAGIKVYDRRLGLHEGIQLVRARLAPASGSASGLGSWSAPRHATGDPESASAERPRLFVHERCERLIECLQRYHYPDDRPESETPDKTDGFDHACDALRYLIVNLDRPAKHTSVTY